MPTLKGIARRILHPNDNPLPVAPAGARDGYPSWIFSLDDQCPRPSQRLLEIAMQSLHCIVEGQVDLTEIAARANVPDWFNVWPGEHYYLLASLMLVLQPQQVVEIGTYTGLSALAMKKYLPSDGRIITFDIQPWNSLNETVLTQADFADQRLVQRLADLSDPSTFEQNRQLLEASDFIFVDGPKDGRFEHALLELLQTLRFRSAPIVMFDDTRLWSMLRFWREAPLPKLDLTSFGSWSGSGLMDMDPGRGD